MKEQVKTITATLAKGETIDIKRFYMNGTIDCDCPKCGSEINLSLSNHYLNYPTVGSDDALSTYCSKCDDYINIPIVVRSFTAVIDVDMANITMG